MVHIIPGSRRKERIRKYNTENAMNFRLVFSSYSRSIRLCPIGIGFPVFSSHVFGHLFFFGHFLRSLIADTLPKEEKQNLFRIRNRKIPKTNSYWVLLAFFWFLHQDMVYCTKEDYLVQRIWFPVCYRLATDWNDLPPPDNCYWRPNEKIQVLTYRCICLYIRNISPHSHVKI